MEYRGVLTLTIIASGIILLIAICFLLVMLANRSKRASFSKTPDFIFKRYRAYYSSFIAWTIVQYALMLVPLFTSTATVYFTADFLQSAGSQSAVWMAIMSFLSALLPVINSRVLSKTHADGFYRAFTELEQGMLKYEHGVITEIKDLINIAADAEKHSNPLAHCDIKDVVDRERDK